MERLISPELRRNCWLELTPARLALMPVVLLLAFYFVHSVASGQMAVLIPAAGALFFLVTVLWGSHLAVSGLSQEVANRTWDWQRMSSITPLEMTAGKLIGSPIYAWYGGVLCLAVLLAAGMGSDMDRAGYAAATLVGLALLAHATAVIFTILAITKYGASSVTRRRSAAVLFGLAIVLLLSRALDPSATLSSPDAVSWYGIAWNGDPFWLASVYAFGAWAWIGTLHLFRVQLGHRNPPWAFAVFALFLMAYSAGFIAWPDAAIFDEVRLPEGTVASARLLVATFVIGALTLVMLFQERHDPVTYRRLVPRGGPQRWHLLPRWFIAFGLTTVSAAAWILLYGDTPLSGVVIAAWLFLLRDAAVILALNFRAVSKPANGLILVYLAVVYALLPGIFGPSSLFVPQLTQSIAELLPPAIEAAAALALLRLAWGRYIGPATR
ncbi:MAG: hypothetical protein WEC99_06070 [Halofilum sp. (in: g-proteobacteria)]